MWHPVRIEFINNVLLQSFTKPSLFYTKPKLCGTECESNSRSIICWSILWNITPNEMLPTLFNSKITFESFIFLWSLIIGFKPRWEFPPLSLSLSLSLSPIKKNMELILLIFKSEPFNNKRFYKYVMYIFFKLKKRDNLIQNQVVS